jgi:hypothetical protein
MSQKNKSQFASTAAGKRTNLLGEFFAMMKQNKKFWLGPIIIILLLFGLLIALGSSAAAPFIYSLF